MMSVSIKHYDTRLHQHHQLQINIYLLFCKRNIRFLGYVFKEVTSGL